MKGHTNQWEQRERKSETKEIVGKKEEDSYCWTNNCLVRWKFADIWCAGWSVGRENPPPT